MARDDVENVAVGIAAPFFMANFGLYPWLAAAYIVPALEEEGMKQSDAIALVVFMAIFILPLMQGITFLLVLLCAGPFIDANIRSSRHANASVMHTAPELAYMPDISTYTYDEAGNDSEIITDEALAALVHKHSAIFLSDADLKKLENAYDTTSDCSDFTSDKDTPATAPAAAA